LKQAMTFKTKISHIKELKRGEGLSYGYRWKAKRKSKIATIPVGYGDGYPRNMYGKGYVTLKEQKVPVIGVICMDQCMIDITDVEDVKINDVVTLFSDGSDNTLSIHDMSVLADTNKNELVSRITRRTPRVYIKDNKIFKIRNYLLGE
ncbi:alanine racemase, partial [bacterium]|nr:alanine racemase [bacterium]